MEQSSGRSNELQKRVFGQIDMIVWLLMMRKEKKMQRAQKLEEGDDQDAKLIR